jgi:hypothetical protein
VAPKSSATFMEKLQVFKINQAKTCYWALLRAKFSKEHIVVQNCLLPLLKKYIFSQFAASQPDVALEEVACAWLNHYTRVTFQVVKGTLLK